MLQTRRGRRIPAGRGDLQPGRPVRRLHRDAARRLPRTRVHGIAPARAALARDPARRRPPRPQPVARPARRRSHGSTPRSWSPPTSRPATPRSTSTAACPAPETRARCRRRLVAGRAARLMRGGRRHARRRGEAGPLSYVIGTEVPVPGGAHETLGRARRRHRPRRRATTLAAPTAKHSPTRDSTTSGRASSPWSSSPASSSTTSRSSTTSAPSTARAAHVLDDEPHMVFEAHSTDYQTPRPDGAGRGPLGDPQGRARPDVRAARGLFALAAIEDELVAGRDARASSRCVERRMLAEPGHWEGYYPGDAPRAAARPPLQLQRPAALLLARPGDGGGPGATDRQPHRRDQIPLPLVSQYLPEQYAASAAGTHGTAARAGVDTSETCCAPTPTRAPRHIRGETPVTTLLGSPAADLHDRGADHTDREIAQQPAVWREVGSADVAPREASTRSCAPCSTPRAADGAHRRGHLGVRGPGAGARSPGG